MKFSAVILAGGKSSRMGRDKAFLEIAGQSLLARQIELARDSGASEIFISGRRDVDYSRYHARVLIDRFESAGPLAGIERALAETSSPLVLVLAVDMPDVKVDFVQDLISASEGLGAVPRNENEIQPLAALYPKRMHSMAADLLSRNSSAVKEFAALGVQSGFARFINCNTYAVQLAINLNSPHDLPASYAKRQ